MQREHIYYFNYSNAKCILIFCCQLKITSIKKRRILMFLFQMLRWNGLGHLRQPKEEVIINAPWSVSGPLRSMRWSVNYHPIGIYEWLWLQFFYLKERLVDSNFFNFFFWTKFYISKLQKWCCSLIIPKTPTIITIDYWHLQARITKESYNLFYLPNTTDQNCKIDVPAWSFVRLLPL